MIDVSAQGAEVMIVALASFPIGFKVSQFADDIDPLVAEDVETTGFEMLYDGSLFAFDKAAAVKLAISVIAGSDDDTNLKILLQSRKGTKSILPFEDSTNAVITFSDGGRVMLTNGTIISGPLVDGLQSTGRRKGNTYTFMFGGFAGAQSKKALIATIAQGVAGLF